MQRRSVINSPGLTELRRKKNKQRKRKYTIYGVLFLVIFIAVCLISRIDKININNINISGNIVIDTKNIENIVNKNINGYYLGIFPKTNFLIYPQRKIENELKEKYKRIKNISIKNLNIRTVDISIEEYEGKYLWCGSVTPELNSNGDQKCYFADSTGYVFDEAPYFSGDTYLKLYGFLNNIDNPSGSYYFKELFSKIIKFNNSLKEIGLKPVYIWVNNQEEVTIGLSKLGVAPISPLIYLKTNSDFEKTIENLQSAISTEPLQSKLKNNYSKLLYVDLRYGNKVYYKFQ